MTPLSPEDLARFKHILISMADTLRESLERETLEVEPVSLDEAIGRLTRVDSLQRQQMAEATRGRLRLSTSRVQSALGRIENGTFGDCIECGDQISIERLEHSPDAPFCIQCQTSMEKR